MKRDSDRQAIIDEAVRRYREALEDLLPGENATLDQVETAITEIGHEVFPDLQEKLINERNRKARVNKIDCACGGVTRYRGMCTKTLITVHGLLRLKRPYYHCSSCKKGSFPSEAVLGLDSAETSLAVRQHIASLVPNLSFAETKAVLFKLLKIDVSASTVERVTVSIGSSLRAAQKEEAKAHLEDRLVDKRTATPKRLYIGADGVMTPLREPWRKDGSAGSLNCRYGECKTGVVYETHTDAKGKDHRVHTRAYTATMEGVETFERLLGTLAHRCGHHAAKEVVVLGDGAPWIWFMFGRLFPTAIQILDFYHACDHIKKVADAIHGKDIAAGREWQKLRQAELKDDNVKGVIQAITAWKPRKHENREIRRIEIGYFTENAERMRYKTFSMKGYHIGSGVVEASCKHVVTQRLDQAGMHWRSETAEAMVTLRAAHLSTSPTCLEPHLGIATGCPN